LGQRDRDAERDLLARRFADSLPSSFPRQGIAAALVANRAGGIDVKPVIVVDFYRSALDANS
jgi:hypothetical protein